MGIESKVFGKLPDGREAHIFTFSNNQGVTAKITNYGGTITSITAPDKKGDIGEVTLGFDNLQQYLGKHPHFGALIGRVGNRIANGRFTLDGKEYQLYTDAAGVHLHGGKEGFDRRLWDAQVEGDRLRLRYVSPDGEENYPGTLDVTVWYSLGDNSELRIDYQATTDKPTIANLTNHSYFNLGGAKRDVLAHEVQIFADNYMEVDALYVPTGKLLSVEGPMDFRRAKPIGRDLDGVPGGYDHNYLFSGKRAPLKSPGLMELAAEAVDPESGRKLAMMTTAPGTQFYIGNFLDGSVTGHGGRAYHKRFGFCLEAQLPPDAINHPNLQSVVLRPGEVYRHSTAYRFSLA